MANSSKSNIQDNDSSTPWLRALATGAALSIAVALPQTIYASGFAISAQSGSAVGSAFSGIADIDDASTIWFNPAGMARLDGLSASIVANVIRPSFKFRDAGSTGVFAIPGTGDGGDGGSLAVVPEIFLVDGLGSRWRFGLGLNVPFGLKTQYQAGWRGEFTALKSEVKTYNVNPALAFVVNKSLSVGAGIDWQHFDAELTNAAGPLGVADLKASDSAWGYNIGAMLSLDGGIHVSAAYRSSISYRLNGTAKFSVGNGLYDSGAQAHLKVPENGSLSIVVPLTEHWKLMSSAVWTKWTDIQTLTVTRTSQSVLGDTGSVISLLPFDWKNTTFVAVGANYALRPTWVLRFGVARDPAASIDATRTARLPDQNRTLFAVGTRLQAWTSGTFDISYGHEIIKNAAVSNTVAGAPGMLKGDFADSADVLSFQFNHQF